MRFPLSDKGHILSQGIMITLSNKCTVPAFHLPANETIIGCLGCIGIEGAFIQRRTNRDLPWNYAPYRILFQMNGIGSRHVAPAGLQPGFIGDPGIAFGNYDTVNMPEPPTYMTVIKSLAIPQTIPLSINFRPRLVTGFVTVIHIGTGVGTGLGTKFRTAGGLTLLVFHHIPNYILRIFIKTAVHGHHGSYLTFAREVFFPNSLHNSIIFNISVNQICFRSVTIVNPFLIDLNIPYEYITRVIDIPACITTRKSRKFCSCIIRSIKIIRFIRNNTVHAKTEFQPHFFRVIELFPISI